MKKCRMIICQRLHSDVRALFAIPEAAFSARYLYTFPEKYGIGNTSAEFEEKLIPRLEGIDKLVFDFAEPDHISSAGLRVVLSALQLLDSRGGSMIIRQHRTTRG